MESRNPRGRPLALVGLVTAGLLIALLALADWSMAEIETGVLGSEENGPAAAATGTATAPESPTAESSDGVAARTELESSGTEDTVVDPDLNHDVEVLVVDADGAPVPGVVVRRSDPKRQIAWNARTLFEGNMLRARDPVTHARTRERARWVSDEEGRARLQGDLRWAFLVAEKNGAMGSLTFPHDPPHNSRLVLQESKRLTVQARKDDGTAAAGVLISAESSDIDGKTTRTELGTTDGRGELELGHIRGLVPPGATQLVLLAEPVGGRVESRAIPLDAPPPVVTLDLPPTGRWTLRLVHEDGRPVSTRYIPRDWLALRRADSEAPAWRVYLDGGHQAKLDSVVLDQKFSLSARTLLDHPRDLDGPTTEQRDQVTEVVLPRDTVQLVGRAVNERGAPYANAVLDISILEEARFVHTTARTDGEGLFEALMFEITGSNPVPLRFLLTTSLAPGADRMQGHREITLPDPGTYDLGDLELGLGTLLVAGRVVRPDGSPSESMGLTLKEVKPDGTEAYAQQLTRWPGNGRFEMRGEHPGTRFKVATADRRFLETSAVADRGTEDIELVLHRMGTVVANLVADEEALWTTLEYRLRPRSASEVEDSKRPNRFRMENEQVRIQWTVPEGRYDLSIHAAQHPDRPLIFIGDLVVPAGAPCEDQRLRGMQLDVEGFRMHRVSVVDGNGEPIETNGWFHAETRNGALAYSIDNGVLNVPLGEPIQGTIMISGYRPLGLQVDRHRERAQLESARSIPFHITNFPNLPAGVRAQLTLVPTAGRHPLAGAMRPGLKRLDAGPTPRLEARSQWSLGSLLAVEPGPDGKGMLEPGCAGAVGFGFLLMRGNEFIGTIPISGPAIHLDPETTQEVLLTLDPEELAKYSATWKR